MFEQVCVLTSVWEVKIFNRMRFFVFFFLLFYNTFYHLYILPPKLKNFGTEALKGHFHVRKKKKKKEAVFILNGGESEIFL